MHPSSKVLGKRKAREDTDEPHEITRASSSSKALVKRKARDNTDQPPKKKRVATSKAKVKAEPASKAKQKGRATGSRNFSYEEIHRLLRAINTRLPIGGKGWAAVTIDRVTHSVLPNLLKANLIRYELQERRKLTATND
jgi:hypothetical protein